MINLQGERVRDGCRVAAKWGNEDDIGTEGPNKGFQWKERKKNVVQHHGGDAWKGAQLGLNGGWDGDSRECSEEMPRDN